MENSLSGIDSLSGAGEEKPDFVPLRKGDYPERKEFAPPFERGEGKFFPNFQKGLDVDERKYEVTKIASLVRMKEKHHVFPVP